MKKILIVSLIILSSTVSYGRVVRVSRPASRPRINSTRSYSKPKVVRVKSVSKPITHKTSIKPKTTSFSSTSNVNPKSNSSYLIPTTPKKSLFNNNDSFSSSGSSYSSSYNNSSGFGLFDFLLLNSIINNSNNHKTAIKEVDNIDENKIIAILKKEIQEEKSKEKPDDKKIKEYQELLNKIKKEK